MNWHFPISGWYTPGVPVRGHPGAFSSVRKHHIHEGVDIYCDHGIQVRAVEAGLITHAQWFTGPEAGSPWWLPTYAVFVEGASGLVVYGEVNPRLAFGAHPGAQVKRGQALGRVERVLRKNKGLPMSMLHIELRAPGHTERFDWQLDSPKPDWLLDPTPYLLEAI